jgi:alkylhydroperoxidase family enzyme
LPPEEWTDDVRGLMVPSQPDGGPPLNIFTTLARHPKLFASWLAFGGRLLVAGTIPARDRELVILRTAFNCRSAYEWGQHVRIARDAGIDDATIARVARWPRDGGWDEHDSALLLAADELHRDAIITDATWGALAARYDDRQLIELTMLVGQYHLVAFALNSLGVQPEPGLEPLPDATEG